MNSLRFTELIEGIKHDNSCIDFFNSRAIARVSRSGQCIHCPSQIRTDDLHPSFAVYDDSCYDFATGTSYDIFSLFEIFDGLSFKQTFEKLSGVSLEHDHDADSAFNAFAANRKALAENIAKWHNILHSTKKAADYLSARHISADTANSLLLGYNPDTDRLIIPFFRNDKPVYYSGRDLSGKNSPKYKCAANDFGVSHTFWGLNSIRVQPSNPRERKLFCDFDISDPIDRTELKNTTLVVTEGLIDAISLYQERWQVIATGAGAISQKDMPEFLKYCRMFGRVCLAFDNDGDFTQKGRKFQLDLAKKLLAEHIPFTCAHIPHEVNGQPVKDINDYYCAGGDFYELINGAVKGIIEIGDSLNTLEQVHKFVMSITGYESKWDIQQLYMHLCERKQPVSNEGLTDVSDIAPLFNPKQLMYVFKEASRKLTDKELIRRVTDKHNILYALDGKFYEYTGKIWEQITRETVERYVSKCLGESATSGRCRAVANLLKAELECDEPFNAQHVMVFKNGVFLLDEPDPEKRFVRHSPDFMSTILLPYNFSDEKAVASKSINGNIEVYGRDMWLTEWGQFLRKVFVRPSGKPETKWDPKQEKHVLTGRPEFLPDFKLIKEVQKMCGYIMFTDNRLEKCFFLLGRGGNGKLTFMQILEEVFGSEFVTHLRPDRLSSQFDPIVLRNSILNICHESARNLAGAEETLKAAISGNPIMASYKGVDVESFKSRAKWFIAGNSLIDIQDVSDAFTRRMIFVPFLNTFKDENLDVNLLDKLRAELPIIFNWCYRGYLLLKAGETFHDTEGQSQLRLRMREHSDHTITFVREYFLDGDVLDADGVECNDGKKILTEYPTEKTMYIWYCNWCKASNIEPLPRPQAIERINDAIEEFVPGITLTDLTDNRTGRTRRYYVMRDFDMMNLWHFDEASQAKIASMVAITSHAIDDTPESGAEDNGIACRASAPVQGGDVPAKSGQMTIMYEPGADLDEDADNEITPPDGQYGTGGNDSPKIPF